MPADTEDQTDISGLPETQSQGMTPGQVAKSMKAQTAGGHMKAPGSGEANSPADDIGQDLGAAARNVGQTLNRAETGAERLGSAIQGSGMRNPLPSWSQRPDQDVRQTPVFQALVNDPWYAYQTYHRFFGDLSDLQNAVGQVGARSVQQQWEQGKANAWTAAQVQSTSAAVNPIGFLLQEIGGVKAHGIQGLNPYQGLSGRKLERKEEEDARAGYSQVADPATYLQWAAPASKLAMAGMGVYGAATQFFGSNQPLSATNLLWTMVAGVMWSGHIPGGSKVKEAVKAVLPSWDRVAEHLISQGAAGDELRRLSQTPEGRAEVLDRFVNTIADTERVLPYQNVLRTASESGKKLGTAIKDTDTGEIQISFAEKEKQLRDLLKSNFGDDVRNLTDLHEKAERGELNTRETEAYINLVARRKLIDIPRDLVEMGEGERALVNPGHLLDEIDPKNLHAANRAGTNLAMILDQMHRGPFGNAEDPVTSVWRSLIGHNRATSFLHGNLIASWIKLMGKEGAKSEAHQHQLVKALEGKDPEAFENLSPEEKFVVESARLVQAGLRRAGRDIEHPIGELPNYFPRMRMKRPGEPNAGQLGDLLTDQSRKSRALRVELGLFHPDDAEDPEALKQGIIVRQAHDTVDDANAALKRQRDGWIRDVLDHAIDANKLADSSAVKRIRDEIGASEEKLAKAHANQLYPDFDTNFIRVMNRSIGHRVAALHSWGAVRYLQDSEGRPLEQSGVPRKAAIPLQGLDNREIENLRKLGYGEAKSPWYRGVLFHPDFLKLLKRSEGDISSPLSKGNFLSRAAAAESRLIQIIMYSPFMHGFNLAGRMGIHMGMHPLTWVQFLTDEGVRRDLLNPKRLLGMDDGHMGMESLRLRQEAMDAGVKMFSAKNPGGEILKQLSNATGDQTIAEVPYASDADSIPQNLRQNGVATLKRLGKPVASGWDAMGNMLWQNANDFMTTVYHIENETLQRKGWEKSQASLLAARRAMSFGGMVAPEDIRSPMLHDAARLVAFAPNWWRTWAEVLTGAYRDSGIKWTGDRMKQQIANDIKAMGAALGWQKMTGEAFNYLLSGHSQAQNTPGNQDRIEITNPDVIRMLQAIGLAQGIDPNTGRNPTTGAVLVVENPVARQQLATEEAAGFQSGQPGHTLFALRQSNGKPDQLGPFEAEVQSPPSIGAAFNGLGKETAARMSPLVETLAGLGNIDLYSSLVDGQVRHLDPTSEGPTIPSALMDAMASLPGGSNLVYQAQQNIEQQQKVGQNPLQSTQGPFGTKIPEAVKDTVGAFDKSAIGQTLMGMAGVNAPYESAQKTPATSQPTDQQYQNIAQSDQQYQQSMNEYAAMLASGQITPNEWVSMYQQLAAAHSNQMQGLFQGSGSYVNGTDGLLDRYYALENSKQVMTGPGGTFNTDAWIEARDKFVGGLSSAQRNALNNAIVKDQQKYPVVGLYDGSVREYESFQQEWARENGINPSKLRQQVSAYGDLYSDRTRSSQYLNEHPELQQWEEAKGQWEMSPQGILYGLFSGSSTPTMMASLDPGLVQEAEQAAQKAESSSETY